VRFFLKNDFDWDCVRSFCDRLFVSKLDFALYRYSYKRVNKILFNTFVRFTFYDAVKSVTPI